MRVTIQWALYLLRVTPDGDPSLAPAAELRWFAYSFRMSEAMPQTGVAGGMPRSHIC